jgi:hypothetical protein
MMKTRKKAVGFWQLAFSLLLLTIGTPANSQELTANSQKVITRSTMVGVGVTNILDTYLSQEHFKGLGVSFLSTVERKRPAKHWSTLIEHEANLSSVKDRPKSKQELEAAYNFYWGKLYNWHLLDHQLTLQAGGLANVSAGVIYNTSNGNNLAQARFHLNVMPTGVAAYRFQLFNRPMTARYELALPLCGIMFSPNYGQSYYEIFSLGNYDHNIVPTTFVSQPSFRQLITAAWHFSPSTALTLGYLGDYQQLQVNNLKQHVYAHRFMVGIVVER